MSVLYFAFAFAAGAVVFHYFTKYGIRWAGKSKLNARNIVRGLSQDALLTYHSAVEDELRYRRESSASNTGTSSDET